MLEHFFSSKTRVRLLRLFLRHPKRQYYLREIGKLLGESLTPVRRELLNLKKIGLLKESKVANIIYYDVNRNFILFDDLASIVKKTEELRKSEASQQDAVTEDKVQEDHEQE